MKKVSNFEILERLAQENNQEFHMYDGANIEGANTGRKWGWVKFAISNNDVYDMWLNDSKKRRFILLSFLDDDYQRIKEKLESQ